MTAIFRFFLIPFALGLLVWSVIEYRKTVFTVEEFAKADIQYSQSYTIPYNSRSHYLVLANETDEYCFFPYEELVPEGSTLKEVFAKLAKTSQATIWFDYNGSKKRIMGIKTATLLIPPEAGLRSHRNSRWALFYLNALYLGLVAALYWIHHAKSADKVCSFIVAILFRLGWRPEMIKPTELKFSTPTTGRKRTTHKRFTKQN